MRTSRFFALSMTLAAFACAAQACYVEDKYCETDYKCGVECRDYCTPMSNGFYAWDDCYQVCDNVCNTYERCYDIPDCRRTADCRYDEYCDAGTCRPRPANNTPDKPNASYPSTGFASLCEACTKNSDCRENGAFCLALNSGDQVCGRSCTQPSDCPARYSCSEFRQEGGNQSFGQCEPTNGACGASYCRTDADCPENGACVNNTCELGVANTDECSTYEDCKGIKTSSGDDTNICLKNTEDGKTSAYCTIDCFSDLGCDPGYQCYLTEADLNSGVCFRGDSGACLRDADCNTASGQASMVCRNTKCTLSCRTDADCASSADNNKTSQRFYCVYGACEFRD